MPIKISRSGLAHTEDPASVFAVSGNADKADQRKFEAKPEPVFRIGPVKADAEVIAVPLR